jgi:hypothetical protein
LRRSGRSIVIVQMLSSTLYETVFMATTPNAE